MSNISKCRCGGDILFQRDAMAGHCFGECLPVTTVGDLLKHISTLETDAYKLKQTTIVLVDVLARVLQQSIGVNEAGCEVAHQFVPAYEEACNLLKRMRLAKTADEIVFAIDTKEIDKLKKERGVSK